MPAQKQSQETDTPTPPQDNHFICFDRNFDTEKDAEIWTSVLRKSFNKLDEQYLLQRNTPEGVKFIVCMGPYKSAGEADEKHKKISEAINVSMFTQSFKNGDFNIIEPEKEKTGVRTVSTRGSAETRTGIHPGTGGIWAIQAGSYSSFDAAESAREELTQKYSSLKMWVEISGGQKTEIRYRLFIGPYNEKNEDLLNDLKQKRIIREDAFWYLRKEKPE